MNKEGNQNKTWFICIVLAIVTLAAFWPVRQNDFINFDDPDYVSENPIVQQGITGENIKWAFTQPAASNWHPLTWLSHMLDCQLFGLNPGKHHLTSVFLHAGSAILLFLLLRKMTGSVWKSVIVAAVFALHPLRVESVAWISERKDVLSGFFFMLTLYAYAHYAQKPEKIRYTLALVCFALGLMAKPMIVTLPFVLVLLDFWPLRRMPLFAPTQTEHRKLNTEHFPILLEKLPFFALSIASCVVTVWAQKAGGSVKSLTDFPLILRLENALISYFRYIKKFFWPDDLAVFYPHPNSWPGWQVALALVLLIGITFLAVRFARKAPFISVGWFWFLGMMIPVIGIVQVGIQSMADRYTYLPMIGFSIALVWGAAQCVERFKLPPVAWGTAIVAAMIGFLFVTNKEVRHWRDSETVFRRALAVTKNNYTAHANLGIALGTAGELEESERHLRAAREIGPDYAEAHHNLANSLVQLGRVEEARAAYLQAIKMKPDYDDALSNLGMLSVRQGDFEQAKSFYARAAHAKPSNPVIQHNLATALLELGSISEALTHYGKAVQLNPDFAPAHFQMGAIFAANERRDQAVFHFREALRINPEHAEARQQLSLLGE
ncbi:MAG: tetratricopeptide repeat protein [Verrucomicrobia bacterium]|nr:tetratricopeptide repeat protein [Verrucomicrobiota bacterium]